MRERVHEPAGQGRVRDCGSSLHIYDPGCTEESREHGERDHRSRTGRNDHIGPFVEQDPSGLRQIDKDEEISLGVSNLINAIERVIGQVGAIIDDETDPHLSQTRQNLHEFRQVAANRADCEDL